ncbi:MAG: DoxX family protein [Bacillota bacterium]|nr:DoxX family protein [Bacillota bacterium]REJ37637.1 MAG: DoxX family protein [Bacillota bacterium]
MESGRNTHIPFSEPPWARFLLSDTRPAVLWLVLRVWLGWGWLQAGMGKVGSPAWTGEQAGAAVAGFVARALERAGGDHPDVPGWYAWFLENVVLNNAAVFGHLVAYGEVLVGAALILGCLTGIAAFFGTFMNMAFLLAGTVSSNPIYFAVGTWLVLAWRNAGWYGLDRWVLPALGTPWEPGSLFQQRR